ncbi:hypothetical protein [Methanosarcina sp. Kolksee]|uniref:hypothetical protein n=1 Tax=Methanosarcina sp. Kolksee TaxID=1434099 RepID=UPI0012E07D92|nr:hypothetical protein [Methanosarcina sp. Kolksee]
MKVSDSGRCGMDEGNEEGKIFPVQDSLDLTHKKFIYYKRVIAPVWKITSWIER